MSIHDCLNSLALIYNSCWISCVIHEGKVNRCRGNFLTAYSKCRGIKYLKRTVFQFALDVSNVVCSSFCTGLTKFCDSYCIVIISCGPVLLKVTTAHYGCNCMFVVYCPVIGSRGKCCCRSSLKHINIVAYRVADLAIIVKLLCSCRSTCRVCMLSDDHTAVCNKCLSCCTLFVNIEPGVCVLNFHYSVRNNALNTKVECSITRNNLSVAECSNIANLYITVCIKAVWLCLCGKSAIFKNLFQLQTSYNTGYIARFIDVCECILEILASTDCCKIACHGNECYIRVFLSSLYQISLMSIAVTDYQGASLSNKVDCCIVAAGVFRNFVFPDDLAVVKAQLFSCFLNTGDMSCRISFCLITYKNNSHLEVRISFNAVLVSGINNRSEGGHCKHHHCCKKKADYFFTHFFHFTSSLIFLFA